MMASTSVQHDTFVHRARAFDWLCGQVPSLTRVDRRNVEVLLEHAKVRLYTRNTVLALADRAPSHVFAVMHGVLAERWENDGLVREIARRGPGAFAGLASLLGQQPSFFEIVAIEHTQVLEFDSRALAQLRAAFHPAAMQLTQALLPPLVAELHAMDRRAVTIATQKNIRLHGLPS